MNEEKTVVEKPQAQPNIQLRSLNDKTAQQFSSSRTSLDQDDQGLNDPEQTRSPSSEAGLLPLQRWNKPRGNIARFASSFYSMFVFGLSDAAYGALLPYVSAL